MLWDPSMPGTRMLDGADMESGVDYDPLRCIVHEGAAYWCTMEGVGHVMGREWEGEGAAPVVDVSLLASGGTNCLIKSY